MSEQNEVARILREAADLIERHGWCQGAYRTVDGRRCAAAALMDASRDHRVTTVVDALMEHTGAVSVTRWNDTDGRTHAEVVAALRAAANEAEMA